MKIQSAKREMDFSDETDDQGIELFDHIVENSHIIDDVE